MEKKRYSAVAWKRRHSTAAWKEKIWRSSVEKVDMAQHCAKSRYGTAAQKKVAIAQQCGKRVHDAAAWKNSHSAAERKK